MEKGSKKEPFNAKIWEEKDMTLLSKNTIFSISNYTAKDIMEQISELLRTFRIPPVMFANIYAEESNTKIDLSNIYQYLKCKRPINADVLETSIKVLNRIGDSEILRHDLEFKWEKDKIVRRIGKYVPQRCGPDECIELALMPMKTEKIKMLFENFYAFRLSNVVWGGGWRCYACLHYEGQHNIDLLLSQYCISPFDYGRKLRELHLWETEEYGRLQAQIRKVAKRETSDKIQKAAYAEIIKKHLFSSYADDLFAR
jgi:hypothetical protein